EAAVKRDELVSPRGVSRQFDGAFYRFRTRVGEKDLLAFGTWHRAAQPFCQLRHAFIVKIRAGHVNQFGRLVLNRRDDLRMAMTSGALGDHRCDIDNSVTIYVFYYSVAQVA